MEQIIGICSRCGKAKATKRSACAWSLFAVVLLLLAALSASVSPVNAQSQGFDIGRFFQRQESLLKGISAELAVVVDKIDRLADRQDDIRNELEKLRREKSR